MQTVKSITVQVRNNTPKDIVEKLRNEAAKNPVFSAICHVFAIRERTRQQVTMGTLRIVMSQEGFNFESVRYEECLRFLADLGLGRLDFAPNGKVRALKDIRTTLQSIGQAALNTSPNGKLENFRPRAVFTNLPAPTPTTPVIEAVKSSNGNGGKHVEEVVQKAKETQQQQTVAPKKVDSPRYSATLGVKFDGKMVSFDLPGGITAQELGVILADFRLKSIGK